MKCTNNLTKNYYICNVKRLKTKQPQQSQPLLIPGTEGIKYAGSKLKLLPHIIPMVCGLRDVHSVLDGFSGSTRVSQALYQTGRFKVSTNDISAWSEVFSRCYLQANGDLAYYQSLIDQLNALPGVEGWFTEHYAPEAVQKEAQDGEKPLKFPFQRKNTMRLDAVREQIAAWRNRGDIDTVTESVLLTSLILALDCVDSTLGHFSSYLKHWSKRSFKDLTLRLPRICYNPDYEKAEVLQGDIFEVIKDREWDFAYFDPPYGSNNTKMPPSRVRYASYYHLWTSVILNDHPQVFGRASRREDSRDKVSASVFEDFRVDDQGHHLAMDAIDRMIRETKAHYVLLSYSSSGRATRDELLDILNDNGRITEVLSLDHANHIMARMQWTRKWLNADADHKEYLFLLEKK